MLAVVMAVMLFLSVKSGKIKTAKEAREEHNSRVGWQGVKWFS